MRGILIPKEYAHLNKLQPKKKKKKSHEHKFQSQNLGLLHEYLLAIRIYSGHSLY
jgi:hypothetical protein